MVIHYYHAQGIDVASLKVIDNGYHGHEFEEGSYPFTVEVLSFSGESYTHQGRIQVETIIDDIEEGWPLRTLGLSALMSTLGLTFIIKRKRTP